MDLNCSLCGNRLEQQDDIGYCSGCMGLLGKGDIPEVSYKDLFSDDLEEKLEEVDSALEKMKDNFFLWYLKGNLEHELGSLKKALRSINTSISYRSDFGDAWIRLGLIYSDMHRDAEAIENYKKGLEYDLSDPATLVEAGISLQAMDHPALAAELLQMGLNLSSDDPRTVVSLGKVYSQMGDPERARKALEKGYEMFPHNEEVLRGMAQLLIKANDLEGAEDVYGRILDQNPKDFEALLALGEIHLRRCELKRSMKYYKAVKELDIHVSWPGILRFIVTSLSEIVNRNENSSAYRDDLLKEYDNVRNFIKELDVKIEKTTGPGPLAEVENLVRTLENQRQRLKDEIERYNDMLKTYKVNDSFHAHLTKKVEELGEHLALYRVYDAKQISFELSPFLNDLGRIDRKTYDTMIAKINERLAQLVEVGVEGKDLGKRLDEVERMMEDGDHQGAKFLLKELEITVEGYWEEVGSEYHKDRSLEMERIIKEAKDKFDITGLKEAYRSFETTFSDGPLEVRDAYLEFMNRYEEDSASYFSREAQSQLQEIKYKLVILEKDGADTEGLEKRLDKLRKNRDGETPKRSFELSNELMGSVNGLDEDFKLQMIENRMLRVIKLREDLESIGIEGDLLGSIDSVTATINRAKDQSNPRMAEILSDELFSNVEKALKRDHSDLLEKAINDTRSRMDLLSDLGLEQGKPGEKLDGIKEEVLGAGGDVIEGVDRLLDLKTEIEASTEEMVPKEILNRMKKIRSTLNEAEGLKIDLKEEMGGLDELETDLEDGADLDLLEKIIEVQGNLEGRLSEGIASLIKGLNEENMGSIELLSKEGADGEDFLDVVSKVSRSELLIEEGRYRDAHDLAVSTRNEIGSLILKSQHEGIERGRRRIREILEQSERLSLDVGGFQRELEDLDNGDACEMDELRSTTGSLLKRTITTFKKGLSVEVNSLDRSVRELLKEDESGIPKEDQNVMNEILHRMKVMVADDQLLSVPPLLEEATIIHNRFMARIDRSIVLSKLADIEERGRSIRGESSERMIVRVLSLREQVEQGDMEGVDERIEELINDLKSMETLAFMQSIESMLGEIDDLDNIAKDVFTGIQDPSFGKRKETISGEIDHLMINVNKLYKAPNSEELKKTADRITEVRDSLLELESESRALSKLNIIDRIPALEKKALPREKREEIRSLRQMFESREWQRFLRTWDRIEAEILDLSTRKAPEGPKKEVVERMESAMSRRGKTPVRTTDLTKTGTIGGLRSGAIGKIASQAFAKHMRIDYDKTLEAEVVEEGPSGDELEGMVEMEEVEEEEVHSSLAGVARLIAGSRIQDLKESDSSAVGEEEDPRRSRRSDGDRKKLDALMEGFLDLDTTYDKITASEDIIRTRKKLERMFKKLPHIKALKEPLAHYERGVSYLDKGKEAQARKEFKAATSTALKVLKVHKDIDTALKILRATLDKAKDTGLYLKEPEEVFSRAREHYSNGDLMESAQAIRKIRDILKSRR